MRRIILTVVLIFACLLLCIQPGTADYSCDAVSENVIKRDLYGECPIDGSEGCEGDYIEWEVTYTCIPNGYICPVDCWDRPYYNYTLWWCECFGAVLGWEREEPHYCDVCPVYPVPNYPW